MWEAIQLKNVKLDEYIHQIIDGIMISDGYLNKTTVRTKTSYMVLRQGIKHEQWLFQLKSIFEKYDINCSIYQYVSKLKGREHPGSSLQTGSYVEFGDERDRWYLKGEKIIPKDIRLTPLMLSYWYMGDGHLEPKKRNNKIFYKLILCTDDFIKKDVEFLKDNLQEIYSWNFRIHKSGKVHKSGKGYRLTTGQYDIIKDFLFRTYSYKVDCFNKKWDALTNMDYNKDEHLHWNKKKIEVLKRDYPVLGAEIKYLQDLGHSPSSIMNMAFRLKLKSKSLWTKKEDEYILKKYRFIGSDIHELEHRSRNAIKKRAKLLGVKCDYSFNQYGKRKWITKKQS